MQREVTLSTLRDLADRGYGLNAMCSRCRHRADLDMHALIERLGGDHPYLRPAIDRHLVCSACGSKEVETQLHVEDAGRRSRHAD